MIIIDFRFGTQTRLPHPARTEDVKLILRYMVNHIADSYVFSLLLPPLVHSAFISPLLSVTVALQLILSSRTLSLPTEVLCPPVISYQVWLNSL